MPKAPSFVAADVPNKGSTRKGEGMWQLLVKEFISSNLLSARVSVEDRDYKQVYAALAHAIKTLGLKDFVRVTRRLGDQSVYIQIIPEEEDAASGRLS